ncbi:MAG: hypothetical protein JO301_13950 [Chitinophagaceae bacterium]|nr:hypothetical protein [Chitinophagaceae bacterium]
MQFQRILLIGSLVLFSFKVSAQVSIAQGLGFYASATNVTGQARGLKDSVLTDCNFHLQLRQFGLVYIIRAELAQWKAGSVSIGSPVKLGLGFTGNYNSADFNGSTTRYCDTVRGAALAFELPLVMDLNIGLHSAADEKGNFGFYIGAGYCYSYANLHTSVGKFRFDGFDPLLRAGIRMGRNWETRWSLGFAVKGSGSSTRTYGLQILKEL